MLRQFCIALLVFIAKGAGVEDTSGSQCFTNGSILVKNPDPLQYGFFHIEAGNDVGTCSGVLTEESTHLLLNNCDMDVPIQVLFVSDNRGIIRRDNHAVVKVQCTSNFPSDMQLSAIMQVGENQAVQTEIINIGGAQIIIKRPVTSSVQINNADNDTNWLFDNPEPSIDDDETTGLSIDGGGPDEIVTQSTTIETKQL